jgi:catechol 2,3-dioxygenase-like lactoylglutathione lyase family enzyme
LTVRSIFHININCSDLDRSIAFYERLGFHQSLRLDDYEAEADASYEALGLTGFVRHKGPVVMFLGDDLRQTRLDLMQWEQPEPPEPTPLVPQQVGVPRIALWTKGVQELYDAMSAEGYEFVSAPRGPFADRAIKSLVCARDPDGLLVELIEFLPRGSELYSTSGGR